MDDSDNPPPLVITIVKNEQKMATPASNPIVFMDITIGGEKVGRMTFELYADTVPKTAENFRSLCVGGDLTYKASPFHRIIPGFMVQGGDITAGTGTGGRSIYGSKFADESFKGKAGKHTGFGCLSMANSGPNTNGSQFFICTGNTDWLNGRHVVFGKLLSGEAVLKRIESVGSASGAPKKIVIVEDCGMVVDA